MNDEIKERKEREREAEIFAPKTTEIWLEKVVV